MFVISRRTSEPAGMPSENCTSTELPDEVAVPSMLVRLRMVGDHPVESLLVVLGASVYLVLLLVEDPFLPVCTVRMQLAPFA